MCELSLFNDVWLLSITYHNINRISIDNVKEKISLKNRTYFAPW